MNPPVRTRSGGSSHFSGDGDDGRHVRKEATTSTTTTTQLLPRPPVIYRREIRVVCGLVVNTASLT
uniref:Uncharacterized protein n=1 Tax=Oryza meridionalis TaxID=40149 RepID=A0A0E0CQM7_9ORYZ